MTRTKKYYLQIKFSRALRLTNAKISNIESNSTSLKTMQNSIKIVSTNYSVSPFAKKLSAKYSPLYNNFITLSVIIQ